MRTIAFILAWVILLASITPCEDAQANAVSYTQAAIKTVTPQHEQDAADLCGPLCSCSCCAGCTLYYSKPQLPAPFAAINAKHTSFTSHGPVDLALPVWQPPQLV